MAKVSSAAVCRPSGAGMAAVKICGRRSATAPPGLALLAERPHALAKVLRLEARSPQLDELALGSQQLPHDALVARERERRVGGDLLGQRDCPRLELGPRHDLVDEAPALGRLRVDVAADEEQLARTGG